MNDLWNTGTGANYGLKGISAHWLEKLHDRELILDFAERLFQAA